jgi:N-acetylglucosaminyldiphosphoundecaprenol N-acetyl-beta-D-mannosaminyltransferase
VSAHENASHPANGAHGAQPGRPGTDTQGVDSSTHARTEPEKRDAAALGLESRRILGMRVDATCYPDAARMILDLAQTGGGRTCVATVHMVMESYDDPELRSLVNGAELVTSDGVPLVWALRALGLPHAERVYGPDLTPIVCREAARRKVPVGFYGGRPETLPDLVRALLGDIPELDVVFTHSPPYRALSEREDAEICSAIAESGAGVLFVGLGCPKQERWMAAHRERLPCAMVGVGAAFDFLSGAKRQAPAVLQRAGLEWLFRLLCEPRRLARRYAVQNPRFIYYFARQLLRERARAGD